jgi:uncharacterized protein YjbI with pentapeptide repeats
MDLEQVSAAATTLGKLVGLGMGAWKLTHTPLGKEDLPLLKEAAENLLALAPKKAPPRPGARQAALIASAFGEAWRQHWALGARGRPGELAVQWQDYFFSASPQRHLLAEASKRLKTTLTARTARDENLLQAREELVAASTLAGDPLGTETYRALYAAFVRPTESGEAALLPLGPTERVAFERRVLRAYHEGLAAPEASDLREVLLRVPHDRARLVRDLLVADTASWGDRHVFGAGAPLQGLPPMPLEAMYVEPAATATWVSNGKKQSVGPRAVLSLLQTLSAKHPVVLLVADFGLGKSLTARMRAVHLARTFLEGSEVGLDLELPMFVRCAEDFTSSDVDLDQVFRRASQRQARELGIELPLSDPALAPPATDQRALFLLDGLDEVALGERQVALLLRELRDRAGSKHRFVVFSRPAAIPASAHGPEVPRVRLREFSSQTREKQPGGQVAEWLTRWNAQRPGQPALEVRALAARRLLDLAATPILLFMIAFTWRPDDDGALTRTDLFERFFRQVARGKHERDESLHPPIASASEQLREVLSARGLLSQGHADPVEAMLWLLGRTAWEALRREAQGETLSGFHVERIVREELGIAQSAEVARTIRTSLLLVLQAELDGGEPRILFGHRAFKEFLVARHWAGVLGRMVRASSHSWRALELELCGARLIEPDGSAHEFLLRMLFHWDDADRQKLAEWAAFSFNEERLPEGCASFADDPRPLLREAALFLGSMLPESKGLVARTPTTLRGLLAWMWLKGIEPRLRATRLRSPGAQLDDAVLRAAWLDHADLRGASLMRADLRDAHLFRADLSGARLDHAHLLGAMADEVNLEGAALREAFLSGTSLCGARLARATAPQCSASAADLRRADLSRATFNGSRLERANLHGATLAETQLIKAKLAGAMLDAADLTAALLQDADLHKASLVGARLEGVVLRDANLRGVNLRSADLRRADLSGANLEGADLAGADLRDAHLEGARGADLTGAVR